MSTEKWADPVSIVIPAYNEEKRILSSLNDLTAFCEDHFADYEIICVDDGSTDRTWNPGQTQVSFGMLCAFGIKHGYTHPSITV